MSSALTHVVGGVQVLHRRPFRSLQGFAVAWLSQHTHTHTRDGGSLGNGVSTHSQEEKLFHFISKEPAFTRRCVCFGRCNFSPQTFRPSDWFWLPCPRLSLPPFHLHVPQSSSAHCHTAGAEAKLWTSAAGRPVTSALTFDLPRASDHRSKEPLLLHLLPAPSFLRLSGGPSPLQRREIRAAGLEAFRAAAAPH